MNGIFINKEFKNSTEQYDPTLFENIYGYTFLSGAVNNCPIFNNS